MIKSPIKWAGGKTRVMPQLLKHLPKADCLIEPFVGSGTVFMNTEYHRYVLCDSNRALINFFRVLTSDTERLIDTARGMFLGGNNEEQYYKRRELFNSMQWSDTGKADAALLYATLFLYLNRHCFNGVYRINQKGDHNVPFGKYAAPYFPADEMRSFAEKANDTKAIFMHSDFRLSIRSAVYASDDAVIYCDPPYIPSSATANFTAYGKPFTLDDHRDLVTTLLDAHHQHGTRSVISNSDNPKTRAIYSAFNLHAFSVRRSVSAKSRDMAGEVIGVLRVCDCCGRSGGGYCPDCGPVMGASTYGAMAAAGAFDGAEGF
ncbi:TPA: Dam family site-specific DNA-(adenine-N6)-methyltransferase [Klebsiella quasipneumoniae subsp. similipneumoniae]|uniref:DNA adenine methylase n=1 Tax=Klebsiella quasipneumoniae TaxID=1463165 RepID=UPI000E2D1C42|nr:Dam family site-specific DNA-(adenine-N6)-methyltransferase [Klebsiella quasipneumoniae]SXD50496.1 methyl-directed repair DNA adenine methylase [Klebsiella quasipneumoniae]HCT6258540.1 Dam family site-specific DNA-(adenine-N6)-methyltransferase [Klebsiella quasipneumoniae]HDH1380627.1 Dam family site-specific DNA-(adenine-N6)-methyltransferase [Klebsiella quasipneumoniae subsp. similipneumoniae]HDU4849562.1 Dam family site-specific DNA-(adenine-N6)-methyltransferase [Klebsiella quasipneumoni